MEALFLKQPPQVHIMTAVVGMKFAFIIIHHRNYHIFHVMVRVRFGLICMCKMAGTKVLEMAGRHELEMAGRNGGKKRRH